MESNHPSSKMLNVSIYNVRDLPILLVYSLPLGASLALPHYCLAHFPARNPFFNPPSENAFLALFSRSSSLMSS